MTRATKEIVAEWIALEDQDDDENDEEEVNDEDGVVDCPTQLILHLYLSVE